MKPGWVHLALNVKTLPVLTWGLPAPDHFVRPVTTHTTTSSLRTPDTDIPPIRTPTPYLACTRPSRARTCPGARLALLGLTAAS